MTMERNHLCRISGWFCLVCCLAWFGVASLYAAELRIDNEILPEGVKSTTYLLDGDFFSMIGRNGEITFYDSKTKTFTILDPALRIQARIDGEETKKRTKLLRDEILHSPKFEPGTFNAFVVKPVFQTEYEESSGNLALESPWFDYAMETSAFSGEEAVKQYFDFCDASCYLNFRLSRSKAMLVRLEVNKILASKRRFPSRISASIYPKGKGPLAKAEKAESTHKLVLRLSTEDRQRIEQARESMRTFPAVPFSSYEEKVAEKIKMRKK